MPVWNGIVAGPDYFHKAVFSLVHQDYEGPVEIIVVDDGSGDETLKFVREWADQVKAGWQSRRIVVASRPHEGVTHSLNHGIRLATGEFVARHDADDWSAKNRLTEQVEYLKTYSEVAMVGSAVRVVHGTREVDEVWYRASGRVPKASFGKQNPLAHGSVMIRRSVLTEVNGYDTQFPHAQDYDMFWRIACLHPIATISNPLYFYRVHDRRVTSDRRKFQIQLQCSRRIQRRIQRELRDQE